MKVSPPRVSLRLLAADDARRVLAGLTVPGQSWGREYPTFIERDVLEALVHAHIPGTETGPFGQYQVELLDSATVIGGAGFLGPPDEFGAVQLDLQVIPDQLGRGYEAEVVAQLISIARDNAARFVIATAEVANQAAQASLAVGGLDEIVRDDNTVHFGLELVAPLA